MKSLLTIIYVLLFPALLCVSGQTGYQHDSADLVSRYWNRILPRSVTSVHNYLYSGIDNYLVLDFPDEESKAFHYYLTTHNGELFEADGGYLHVPVSGGHSFIAVNIIIASGDTLLIGKKDFLVKNVPYPVLKTGRTIIDDHGRIDRRIFLTGDSLKLYFTDDIPESNSWYRIVSFSFGYSYGGVYISADNEGAVFNGRALNLLARANPGEEVAIKVTAVSPSGILRFLPVVRFFIY